MPTAVNRRDERKHRHTAIDTGVQRSCQRLTAAQPELHPSRRPLPPSSRGRGLGQAEGTGRAIR
jgi:hypothetical protein